MGWSGFFLTDGTDAARILAQDIETGKIANQSAGKKSFHLVDAMSRDDGLTGTIRHDQFHADTGSDEVVALDEPDHVFLYGFEVGDTGWGSGTPEILASTATMTKIAAMILTCMITTVPMRAQAQFRANCVDAAPGLSISELEFDQIGFRAVWQDDPLVLPSGAVVRQGAVNIADVNPTNGDIVTPAQVVLGANPAPLIVTRNGPEWGYGLSGTSVFYTTFADATYHDVRISRIELALDETWRVSPELYPLRSSSALASLDASLPAPYVSFTFINYSSRNLLGFGTGEISGTRTGFGFVNSASPGDVTNLPPEAVFHGRFISDQNDLLLFFWYEEVIGGVTYRRPAYYDVNAQEVVGGLITDRTVRTGYFAMQAPELAAGATGPLDDIIIMALTPRTDVSGAVDLELFKIDRRTGQWAMFNKIVSTSSRYVAIASPESFVFNGRSYVSMTVISKSGNESVVAIASLVPRRGLPNIMRVVSPTTIGVRRNDPETFRVRPNGTTEKVIAYYAERSESGIRTMRCETGL